MNVVRISGRVGVSIARRDMLYIIPVGEMGWGMNGVEIEIVMRVRPQ